MSTTLKDWFKGGFWRTNHGYEKLFLVLVCVFFILLELGGVSGAPLGEGRDLMRTDTHINDDNRHHNPQGYPSTGVTAGAVRYGRRHPRGRSRHGRTTAVTPRPRAPPPCFEDPGAKAYLAGTVFEGKARSRSPLRNGAYNVTFVVQEVFKGGEAGFTRSPVRLQFLEKKGEGPECPNAGPLVRANIKRGGKYIVYVDKVGPHSFVARGQPALKTVANLAAVKDVLCHNCVRKTSMSRMEDVTLKVQEKLRLVCRVRGNPPPLLHWYKDGVRVVAGKGTTIKIRNKKRRTTLVIPKVRLEDAGQYECRATSVSRAVDKVKAQVTVTQPAKPETTTVNWRYPKPCPIEHFCMNGGVCTYYDLVGEMSCLCATGFQGTRCDEKHVYNGSMYRPMSYFCKLGLSASYYC